METFKPQIIQAETLDGFKLSDSFVSWSQVEKYLSSIKSADKKTKATSQLITAFALAQSGKKIGSKTKAQRAYLSDAYSKVDVGSSMTPIAQKWDFLKSLANASIVLEKAWIHVSVSPPALPSMNLIHESEFCLAVLRASNHEIILGLLMNYYDRVVRNEVSASEFAKLIKGITAFFALWRGAEPGTRGIDDCYRVLMHGKANQVNPIARRSDIHRNPNVPVAFGEIETYFQNELKKIGIVDRKSWVDKVSSHQIYKSSQPLTKFLLFAATNDSVPDIGNPGLIVKGQLNTLPLLQHSRWIDESLTSVEHIAPQNPLNGNAGPGSWQANPIYSEPELVNSLGNLLLIPIRANSGLGNEDWEIKRHSYKVLSAHTAVEAATLKADAKALKVQLPKPVLANAIFSPVAAGMAHYRGSWDQAIIRSRTVRLAELAWDEISAWVGL